MLASSDVTLTDMFCGAGGSSTGAVNAGARVRLAMNHWQRYASPVWFDINRMRVLNTELAREDRDEKHLAPLQLDVIDRAIDLWTNPGEMVFDPFAGVGSSGVCALKAGRRFLGSELKAQYFRMACRYLRQTEDDLNQPRLFDALEEEAVTA